MKGSSRKTSPNPQIKQSNVGRSSRKDGAFRRKCSYCDDDGVVPQKTFYSYRSFYWLKRRYPKKRWSEPKCKMVPCPVCHVGGL